MFRTRPALLGAVGLLAAAFAVAPGGFALPPMPTLRGGYAGPADGAGSMVRMQSHTGAGGRGAHRRWKRRRAAGRY